MNPNYLAEFEEADFKKPEGPDYKTLYFIALLICCLSAYMHVVTVNFILHLAK